MRLADPGCAIGNSSCKVSEIPKPMQPREEVARRGVGNVSDAVLLALILRTGTRGANVVDIAEGLLRRYGSLSGLAAAPPEEIRKLRGIGPVGVSVLKAAFELGRRLTDENLGDNQRIRTPEDAARVLREEVRTLDHERFWVLLLDKKNGLKCKPVDVSRGILDASLVHPREVFRSAIVTSTAHVVIAHNHPSGDPTPSAEDVRLTRQLVEAGRIVDIKVLDHVVMGRPGRGDGRAWVSMREAGLVEFN